MLPPVPSYGHFMFTRMGKRVFLLILVGVSAWIYAPATHSEPLKAEYRNTLNVVRDGAILANHSPFVEPATTVKNITLTAYSSSYDETDDTPDITASGTKTRPGIVAANFLPFGAKVRIPRIFGDKVFTVEDRMHSRFQDRLDIWFPTKQEAKRFGLQFTEVEIEI